MTDDTEPPRKIVSRRKSHLKGPQAQESDSTKPEPAVTESNTNGTDLPSASDYVVPVDEERPEESVPYPEPEPEPSLEAQAESPPTESVQEQTDEMTPEVVAPNLTKPVSNVAPSSDISVSGPLAEE